MTTVIETRSLSKTYGTTNAVVNLDLVVGAGEVFGFLGPNGAGKTTTIRVLLGLQRATRGRAWVLGLDSQSRGVDIHRRVGYLPGDLELYAHLTGRQHIEWFRRARGLSERASLADSLIERFAVVVNRPVGQLSKGNRQKIGLVLAFMHRPDLLILDEPTSGLDPLMQNEFDRLVRETADDGRTVFLSSHDLDEVQRLADRVSIVKAGKLVMTDTVNRLRESTPYSIEVRFGHPIDASLFSAVPGVSVRYADAFLIRAEATGAIAPVLRLIAEYEPVDVVCRHADLDELFLELYRSPTMAVRSNGD